VIETLGFGDSLQIRLGAALMIRSIFKCFSSLRVATCCLASLAAIVGSPAIAATLTWDPAGAGGGDGSWNTTDSSWDNAGTPQTWVNAAGDTAIFGGTAGTVTLGEAISAAGLQFDTAGYTITANTLTLTGTAELTANADATIASTLGGTSPLLKSGTGTVQLTADNAVSGGIVVNAGTLEIGGSGRLNGGNYAGDITTNGTLSFTTSQQQRLTGAISGTGGITSSIGAGLLMGGTSSYSGTTTIGGTGYFEMSGGAVTIANSVLNLTSTNASRALDIWAGKLTVRGLTGSGIAVSNGSQSGQAWWVADPIGLSIAVPDGESYEFTGTINNRTWNSAAVLTIEKAGTGTQRLSGGNGYTGSTIVTAGTLIVGNGAGGGAIGGGPVAVASGATFTVDRGGFGQVWSNNFSGEGTLRIEGGQDPQFAGDNSSFTGPVIIDGTDAQFRTRSANAWSGQSVVTISNGGMASVFSYVNSNDIKVGSLWGDGTVRIGAGGADRDLYVGGNDLDGTFSGTIVNDAGGSGSVIKLGTGTQTLSGNNSYSGGTIVSAGTLVATVGNALSNTGTVTLGDANSAANEAAVFIDATAGGVTIGRAITVANQGTGTFTLGSATASGGNTAAFSGAVTLARDVTLDGGSAGGRLDFSGGISGTGNVTVAGSNRVIFMSNANTYAGATTINGVLQLSDGSGTATSLLPDGQPVTVAGGGELRLAKGNNSETIGALLGGGTVSNIVGGITSTLIIGDGDGSGTFSGLLDDPSGTLAIEKTGTGTQTFSNANTYSGSTTINAGTLLAGNASAFGTTGTITVNAGGTLGVGDGVDFTGRAFTLNTGGKVWLGDGATIALPDAAALAAWESTNTAGGDGTVADILYGAGGTQPSALTSGWTANPGEYFSDILTLEGTGSGNTYVLSMEYSGAFGDMNIWYRDTVNDPFVPLGTTSLGQQAWNSSFTTPGQYGIDPSTSTVWVVTDHNSQFVVVPEPTSLAALAAAIGGLAVAARYKAGRRT
jgi:fibronectin-binding autotransporter adhesin